MATPSMGGAPTNTYIATGASKATNQKEDLLDVISRTSPTETPVVTAIGYGQDAKQVTVEWLTEELQAADDNKQPEGFEFAGGPPVRPTRLNNTCQIMSRAVIVSETLSATDVAGGDDEYDRQMIMRGLEVRRDLEWRLTRDKPKVTTDPREMAGIPCYLKLGSAGAGTGAMPAGDGTNGHTAGTARALTLALIADAKQACFDKGGMPDMGIMTSTLKRQFSALSAAGGTGNAVAMDNVLQATEPKPTTYVGAVDVYLTDFGPVEMVPDIFAPAAQILLLDPNFIELAALPGRAFTPDEYAKTGDNSKGAVVFEGTVRVKAPNTSAAIYDLS